MPIRNVLTCVLTGMLCLGFFCPKAAHAAQTPQEFVKEFYEWYIIKHYEHHAILKEEKLQEYVDASLIEELEKKGPIKALQRLFLIKMNLRFRLLQI